MAPTICSGKKRQTRTIATTSIRRHGQGSHQLNPTLSNIVNYVAKGSLNPRVSGSLRLQTHNPREKHNNDDCNQLKQTSASSAANHRRQQYSFISDNAVTSSAHSDTENSIDLRLANEILINGSMATCGSSNTNSSSLPSSLSSSASSSLSTLTSLSAHKGATSSAATSLCDERTFKSYSSLVHANNSDDIQEVASPHKQPNQMHSTNIRKQHYYDCNDFDSDADEEVGNDNGGSVIDEEGVADNEEIEYDYDDELDHNMSNDTIYEGGNDSDGIDSEKSVKRKRAGNHPLLRDKLLANQQISSNNIAAKSLTNISNTDGLLSIAIKTIKLVKRNQLLQQRLTQLQLETSEFIQSVLANPENRRFRENIKQKVQEVDNI